MQKRQPFNMLNPKRLWSDQYYNELQKISDQNNNYTNSIKDKSKEINELEFNDNPMEVKNPEFINSEINKLS